MSVFTWAWIAWGAAFAVIEGVALVNSRHGDTLSEHVWGVDRRTPVRYAGAYPEVDAAGRPHRAAVGDAVVGAALRHRWLGLGCEADPLAVR